MQDNFQLVCEQALGKKLMQLERQLPLLLLQDGLFMIAFDKPWAAVEWSITLQLAMLK